MFINFNWFIKHNDNKYILYVGNKFIEFSALDEIKSFLKNLKADDIIRILELFECDYNHIVEILYSDYGVIYKILNDIDKTEFFQLFIDGELKAEFKSLKEAISSLEEISANHTHSKDTHQIR